MFTVIAYRLVFRWLWYRTAGFLFSLLPLAIPSMSFYLHSFVSVFCCALLSFSEGPSQALITQLVEDRSSETCSNQPGAGRQHWQAVEQALSCTPPSLPPSHSFYSPLPTAVYRIPWPKVFISLKTCPCIESWSGREYSFPASAAPGIFGNVHSSWRNRAFSWEILQRPEQIRSLCRHIMIALISWT